MRLARPYACLLGALFALACMHCDAGETSQTGATGTGGQSTSSQGPGGSGGGGSGSTGGGGSGTGGNADPCAGRLLCDDFEDDPLGAAPASPWEIAKNNGSVVVDATRARSGKQAIKVRTESGQYKQALFHTGGAPVFPAPGNVIYGRMMIYMDQAANDGVHWTMIQGSGPLAGHDGVTAHYRYGGQHQQRLMANYETSNLSTDCWDHSATVMPTARWACMEWRFDGPSNKMQFWLDGQEITDMAVTQKGEGCIGNGLSGDWLAPTFDRMYLGWESYQQDEAREAWIDDVILDDEKIGCP